LRGNKNDLGYGEEVKSGPNGQNLHLRNKKKEENANK
jgi:hypothetical protein